MIWRSALGFASRGRLSILMFHRVLPRGDMLFPGEPVEADFDALMVHVKSRFNVLPLQDAVRRLRDGTLPARALSITFDDGYADNLSIAAPILRRHALHATVFIATGYLDKGCMWNDRVIEAFRSTRRQKLNLEQYGLGTHALDTLEQRRAAIDRVLGQIKYLPFADREQRAQDIMNAAAVPAPATPMLTRASVRALVDCGLDIGGHTVRHPILANTSSDDAWREIAECKRELEALVDGPVILFAYPNGKPGRDYTAEHVRMVREAGFIAAVTTADGAGSSESDVYQLPRFTPWTRRPVKFDLLMLRNLRQGFEQRAS
jgi:peptidoglycan/xylan/chitin deacetylase (PgdA/CDA1 family)